MTTARISATRALLAITERQATLATAIDAERRALTDARDRALALELVAGALRWRAALDFVIADASRRTTEQIDRTALAVLRIAVYQLRHLDRVPDHAVVSESVETIRQLAAPRAAGFVNAVLRQAIRRRTAVRLPREPSSRDSREAWLAYLSTTLSHPRWLVERWLTRFGYEQTKLWCEWNNAAPLLTVRSYGRLVPETATAIVDELQAAGISAERSPYVDDAVRLPPGALGRLAPELRDRLWVQDEGAQLVARAAGVLAGERVLDLCASPGGKSLVLAHDLGISQGLASSTETNGLLVSADFRTARVDLLARTLRRENALPAVVRLDAREPLPFAPVFDCVLVDVPCSGLGTLRRDPDLKWAREEGELPTFAAAESAILAKAAEVVKPGGRLVYATCSSEPEENDAIVDAFLTSNPEFCQGLLGEAVPESLITPTGRLTTRPDLHGLDAFFAVVLVRRRTA